DVAAALRQLVQRPDEAGHEAELDRQALGRSRSGRNINRHDAQISEARLQITTLGIDVRDAQSGDDLVWFPAAIDADAAVAGPLGTMKVAVVSVGIAYPFGEV